MKLTIDIRPCIQSTLLPLISMPCANMTGHFTHSHPLPFLKVGSLFYDSNNEPLFKIAGKIFLPAVDSQYAIPCPLLLTLKDITIQQEIELTLQKKGLSLAWITLSDKGYIGQREDLSGPAIAKLMSQRMELCHIQGFILPDNTLYLQALLTELALSHGYDIICTTGGTGLSPQDVSPEATLAVIQKRLYGFEQAMMAAALGKTPHAAISRAIVGTLGSSIIINTPGSLKAVMENLSAILPALPHALDKLNNDPTDCGA